MTAPRCILVRPALIKNLFKGKLERFASVRNTFLRRLGNILWFGPANVRPTKKITTYFFLTLVNFNSEQLRYSSVLYSESNVL